MKNNFIRYIAIGQACFYLGILLCISIRPEGLSANAGISYYGVYKVTILPFILAVLGPGIFCVRAGLQLDAKNFKFLRNSLIVIGVLMIGILLTPDTLSIFVADLHQGIGSLLFISQLIISAWITHKLNYDLRAILLVLIELTGGVLAYIYLKPINGYLLQSQVLFQVGFGVLAIYALPRIYLEATKH